MALDNRSSIELKRVKDVPEGNSVPHGWIGMLAHGLVAPGEPSERPQAFVIWHSEDYDRANWTDYCGQRRFKDTKSQIYALCSSKQVRYE